MDLDIDFSAALDPQPVSVSSVAPLTGPLIPEIVDEEETLPILPDFDTQAVAALLLRYEQEVVLMEQRSRTITIITDEATNLQAAEWGQQAKKLYNKLEELRQYFVRPHLDFNQAVNAFFKRFTERLKAIDASMGRLESAYARLKENERRIKEAEAKKAAEEQKKLLDQEAEAAAAEGIIYEPITPVPQIIPEEPKVTRTAEGSSHQSKKWVCEIIDPDKVPREYCIPDQRLLNEAVKAGVRTIAGCEIEHKFTTVRRV